MVRLYCVRAEFGKYTDQFVRGGYVALGWSNIGDLSNVSAINELYPIYKSAYPNDTSNVVVGQQVGQFARFLFQIQPGDYVITPAYDTEHLYYGVVKESPIYYYAKDSNDGCPYLHRRPVEWNPEPVSRGQFSVPFQNTIRSSLTVFAIAHENHFFSVIGKYGLADAGEIEDWRDYYKSILKQILKLDATEFEILITHLLTALGFESSQHTGKVGDGGIDAKGEMNIANMAKIKLYVQAKRYKPSETISAKTVHSFRASIPNDAQGAFITTSDFQAKAKDIAIEPGFTRIGLINGNQLVDLLSEHWEDIPQEYKDKLGLKLGLVIA